MDSVTTNSIERRFLILRAARWFPTGLLVPVIVLLLVERGFSLGQIGTAMAMQGVVVLLLELPTGGLADALGRRPVLVAATIIEMGSLTLLLFAESLPALMVTFALQGIYRALESGPLEAWFVDRAQAADPDADIDRGLARGGTVIGVALAAGALVSAGLIAFDVELGFEVLAVPIAAAAVLRVFDLLAIVRFMDEPGRARVDVTSALASVRAVPKVLAEAATMIRDSTVLMALIAVEFVWGIGLIALETFSPAKLAEVVGSTDTAGALFGPVVTVAFLALALGAATLPKLAKRIGAAQAAMVGQLAMSALVVALALMSTTWAVIVFYLLAMFAHGALGPVYQGLLHRQADADHRASVVSAASMAFHPGGAIGGISLGALADSTSLTTAMVVGGLVLLLAIPLYLPAARQAAHAG